MDQEHKELIQAAVDGELDAAGQERFEQLMASSEEARELHEDLQRLADFIGQVPMVEMPDRLHGEIMDGIELPKPSGISRWFRFEELPGFLRYGLAGAAAVVLTVAVYQGGSQMDPNASTDDLLGTIASRGDMAGGTQVDVFRFDANGATGNVELIARGDHYALIFDISLDGPTDLEVDLPGDGFRIDAFASDANAESPAVSWSRNTLNAEAAGDHRFVVRLSRSSDAGIDGSDIRLVLNRDGEILQQGTLSANPR